LPLLLLCIWRRRKKDSSSFSLVSSAPAAPFRPVRGYIHPFDKEEELLLHGPPFFLLLFS
jgi:hypothetical protein